MNSYIATQGPMPNTVYDFWIMIQQNVEKHSKTVGYQKIAMLTDFVENGRQKCATYFPRDLNECIICRRKICETRKSKRNDPSNAEDLNIIRWTEEFDSNLKSQDIASQYNITDNFFLIKNLSITSKTGYTVRKLYVFYCEKENNFNETETKKFYVHHYWFPDWPDHRTPENIDVLLNLSLDLLDDDMSCSPGNVLLHPLPIIHCSAGIGRTGCLAAIMNGLRQMRLSLQNSPNLSPNLDKNSECKNMEQKLNTISKKLNVDILGIVCNLRLQRGGMVQNSEQYELIHKALCLYQERLLQ